MNLFNDQFYDLVFPFRRVFTFEISDLETFKTEGYWASVNCGDYNFYLKIQFFEPPGMEEAYLSSAALLIVDSEDNYFPPITISHRLRVINKKTRDDHVTDWEQCRSTDIYDCTKNGPYKILDWSTMLNDGFAENELIIFKWEFNIEEIKSSYVRLFCFYSRRLMRWHRTWGYPIFRKLKIQAKMFEKDFRFEEKYENFYSLSSELKIWPISIKKTRTGLWRMHFKATKLEKYDPLLLEIFFSFPIKTSYALVNLHGISSDFYLECMDDIDGQSELHFKMYLHELELPFNEFLVPKVENNDIFPIKLRSGITRNNFFLSVLMNYSKLVHDFFTERFLSKEFSTTKSTPGFFRKLKNRDEIKLLNSRTLEDIFLTFALVIHNCEADKYGDLLINKYEFDNIGDLLLLMKILDSPEGFRRCDAMMKEIEFEDDLSILKLVAQYPLPQTKTVYKKKYQDPIEWRKLMQNEDFKSLPPEFVQDLAKNHDNEIECDVTMRYDSSDSNFSKVDQVVFSDFKTGEEHTVNKMILANASDYFWMRFLGPHSHSDDKYVVFDDGIPKNFVMFLNHVYHPTNPITHYNFDALLEMAHRFDAYALLLKLEKFLVFHENYSLADKLKYANDFDLVFVLEFCLNSVKCFNNLEKLKKEEKFIELPAEFKQFVQENIRWRIVNPLPIFESTRFDL
ncbi:unnamed protein product [Caenorhabditis brenneri]